MTVVDQRRAAPARSLNVLLDASPDPIVVADAEGVIVAVNGLAATMFGYADGDLVGEPVETLVAEPLRARHAAARSAYAGHPRIRRMGEGMELAARRRDGTEIPVEISLSPLGEGAEALFVAAIRDVSERRFVERELHLLQKVAFAVAAAEDFDTALQGVLSHIAESVGAVYGEAWVPSAAGHTMRIAGPRYAADDETALLHEAAAPLRFARGTGMVGRAWESGVAHWADDVRHDPLFFRRSVALRVGATAAVTVPVTVNGEGLAVLQFLFGAVLPEDPRLMRLVEAAATAFAPALRRRRDQDALRQAEQHVAAAYRHAVTGIALVGQDATLVHVNPALCRLAGQTAGELAGRDWAAIGSERDRAEVSAAVDLLLSGAADSWEGEQRYARPGGDVSVRIVLGVVSDGEGRPSSCVAHVEDVTARRAAEAALARQAALLDLAHDAVIVRDLDGTVTFWNEGAAATYGWSAAEALGQVTHDLFETGRTDVDRVERAVLGHGRWQGELAHRTSDGRRIVVDSRWAVQRGEDGAPTGFLEVNRDVTARKDAEEALRAAERRVSQILGALPIGVFVIDRSGRPIFANPRAEEILGTGLVVDAHVTELPERYSAYVPGTDELFPDAEQPIARALAGEVATADMELARPGHRVPISVAGTPIYDAAGEVAYALAVFQDVTAERDAAAALERQAADLARSNRELEQFAYVASHDLSEPLRSVTGFSQLLADQCGDVIDETGKEFLGFIVEGVARMQDLISDILAYSRAGRGTLTATDVPLDRVVVRVGQALATTLADSGGRVEAAGLPVVKGSERLLEQVLQNLVANALKFAREDVPPVVEVAGERTAHGWRVSVTDNGIGIDERHRDRVFQMFQRLHTRDEYPGTGIGLAICKKVVERHGGQIWAEAPPAQGTRIVFTLDDSPEAT